MTQNRALGNLLLMKWRMACIPALSPALQKVDKCLLCDEPLSLQRMTPLSSPPQSLTCSPSSSNSLSIHLDKSYENAKCLTIPLAFFFCSDLPFCLINTFMSFRVSPSPFAHFSLSSRPPPLDEPCSSLYCQLPL